MPAVQSSYKPRRLIFKPTPLPKRRPSVAKWPAPGELAGAVYELVAACYHGEQDCSPYLYTVHQKGTAVRLSFPARMKAGMALSRTTLEKILEEVGFENTKWVNNFHYPEKFTVTTMMRNALSIDNVVEALETAKCFVEKQKTNFCDGFSVQKALTLTLAH